MKRKQPETSLAAYHSLNPNTVAWYYEKIINALKFLGEANYETISTAAGFKDRNMASRRLKEMEKAKTIIKTDRKSKTSSGREAFNYTLCIKGDIVEKKNETKEKAKTIHQPTLFQ